MGSRLVVALLAAAGLFLLLTWDDPPPPPPAAEVGEGAGTERLCVRVVDGDTIVLDGGERVRYIGIDTPETKHPRRPVERMGKEAADANRGLVEGRRVRLEYDVERKDRYGRTLAYVHVDGVMVNEELLRRGYAQVSTYPPNVRHVDRFLAAQREAREQARGLWEGGREETVYVTRSGKRYHRASCEHLRGQGMALARGEAAAKGYGPCRSCRP